MLKKRATHTHTLLWVRVCIHAHTYVCVLTSVTKQIPLEPATAPQVPRSSHARWHQAASLCAHTNTIHTLILSLPCPLPFSQCRHHHLTLFSADLQPDLIPGENNYQSGDTVSIEPFWGWQLNHVWARLSRFRLWHSPALLKTFPHLLYSGGFECKGLNGWKVNEARCKASQPIRPVITQCRVRNTGLENDSLLISAMPRLCSVPNTLPGCKEKCYTYSLSSREQKSPN